MKKIYIIERATKQDVTADVQLFVKWGDLRVRRNGKDITDQIYFGVEENVEL